MHLYTITFHVEEKMVGICKPGSIISVNRLLYFTGIFNSLIYAYFVLFVLFRKAQGEGGEATQ